MPRRCPECGRFLATAFVEGLLDEPAPCPRCETVLTPDRFPDLQGTATATDAAEGTPPASVRPPDLPPEEVRGDVLAGWDDEDLASTVQQLADPRNAGIVAAIIGAGVAGGLIGGLVASRRRPAWTVAGTLVGAALAVLGTRVVEDDPLT